MNDPLWKLDRVTLAGRRSPRLEKVDLEIPPGVTAVVGQSGAGKTSLLNLLVGFEQPDGGTISSRLPASGDRLPLFWVPQNLGLWPHLSVAEHLAAVLPSAKDAGVAGARRSEPPVFRGLGAPSGRPQPPRSGFESASTDGSSAENRIDQLLDDFELGELAETHPDRLSQGERSRLSVARAVASGAAVLVMDEPLVHVNPSRAGRYWDVLRGHLRETGTSLIIATHSPEIVLREAKHAVCLSAGRALFVGDVEELYWRPPNAESADFLGAHNWLTPAEAGCWLNQREERARCFRPEQIAVVEQGDGPLVVESSRFAGSLAEVELKDERSGETRGFFHRPSKNGLSPGTRVALKLLALMLFCLLSVGCRPSAGGDAAESVRHWSMPADGAKIPSPRAVHVTADNELYVVDDAGRVLVYDLDGNLRRQWRMPESDVGNPEGICRLDDGRIAVADTHYHRLVFFDREGKVLGMLGSHGEEPGQFIYPVAIVTDDDGNYYVAEYGENDRVQKFSTDGKFLLEFGTFGTEPGQFQRPSGLVWHEKKIYAVDAFNNRIQVFSDTGKFIRILGEKQSSGGLHYPYDITQSAEGDLYVVEYGAGRVSRFDLEGHLLGRFGTPGTDNGQFKTPWGLSISADSRVFVADTGNRRIVELKL